VSPPSSAAKLGAGRLFKFGGQTDVAVVKADHEVAPLGQLLADFAVPGNQLAPRPITSKSGRGAPLAEGLVLDLDSVWTWPWALGPLLARGAPLYEQVPSGAPAAGASCPDWVPGR